MMFQISVWITIVFFAVSRTQSVLGEGSDSICYKGLSRQEIRISSYRVIEEPGFLSVFGWLPSSPEFHTTYKRENYTRLELNCCSGYKDNTKNCTCNAWGGDSCDEPLVCFMVQPNPDQNSLAIEQVLVWNDTKDATNKPLNLSKGVPKQCLPECLNQMKSLSINATQLEYATYFLIPIKAPCNTIHKDNVHWEFVKKHKYILGAGVGIVALTLVVCIKCTVLRGRKSEATEENIPMQTRYPEHMEDNVIYS